MAQGSAQHHPFPEIFGPQEEEEQKVLEAVEQVSGVRQRGAPRSKLGPGLGTSGGERSLSCLQGESR